LIEALFNRGWVFKMLNLSAKNCKRKLRGTGNGALFGPLSTLPTYPVTAGQRPFVFFEVVSVKHIIPIPIKCWPIFIYGVKSLGLFALLIAGIFVALMIARAVDDMKN
jgi:hypothetical protein